MDISTLQRLHRMGILSTGQARHFAMGGLYSDGEPPINLDKLIVSGPKAPSLRTQLGGVVPDNIDNYPMEDLQNNPIGNLATRPSGLDQNALAGYFNRQLSENLTPPTSLSQSGSGVLFPPEQTSWEKNPSLLSMPQTTSVTIPAPQEDSNSFGSDYNAYLADAKKYQGKYRDSNSIDEAYNVGNISKEERDRLQLLSPEDLQKESNTTGAIDQEVNKEQANNLARFPFMNPLGSDFTSNMFQAGRAIRAPKGTPGRGLGIGLNLGAGLLEAARGIGSGMAYQNMNDQARNYYDDQMRKRLYTNASQTQNANITGGVSEGRYGGLFQNNHFALGGSLNSGPPEDTMIYPPGDNIWDKTKAPLNYDILEMLHQKDRRGYDDYLKSINDPTNINRATDRYQQEYYMNNSNISARYGGSFTNNHFAEGGEQMEQEQMMQEQMAQEDQAMAQEQVAPQDKIQQIAEQLVAGLGSLEAIDAYLKEQQVDEATYNSIMQVAQQIIEGQSQSQPDMEEAPTEEVPTEEAPTMRGGGKFKHRVGDKIEFTHKGKKHRGVIKKIENGQIYL